jgi:hypothetical protein
MLGLAAVADTGLLGGGVQQVHSEVHVGGPDVPAELTLCGDGPPQSPDLSMVTPSNPMNSDAVLVLYTGVRATFPYSHSVAIAAAFLRASRNHLKT